MEPKTKKILVTGAWVLAGIGATFGLFKGGKYVYLKYIKPANETGGKDTVITLSDGSTLTVSAEQAKPPSSWDISNMKAAIHPKWTVNGKINQSIYDKIIASAPKLTKYEWQKLIFYLEAADFTKQFYGFKFDDLQKFEKLLQLIKSITV